VSRLAVAALLLPLALTGCHDSKRATCDVAGELPIRAGVNVTGTTLRLQSGHGTVVQWTVPSRADFLTARVKPAGDLALDVLSRSAITMRVRVCAFHRGTSELIFEGARGNQSGFGSYVDITVT
jgi:hypothetical protein